MAINTTGNNGSVVGVTGVHPDNMGNTLVFKNKVYNVNVGDTLTVDENGLVDVKLSNASGNLLQKRNDGLYYGIEPPANIKNLYVDAINGVDQHPDEVAGAGTKAQPLKTIEYAISLGREGTARNILLKENQDHIFKSYILVPSGRLNISVYGDTYDALMATGQHDAWSVGRTLFDRGLTPRLKFVGVNNNKYPNGYTFSVLERLAITSNTFVKFFHITIINNLDFEFDNHPSSTQSRILNNNLSRIGVANGGSCEFSSVKFFTEGTPTVKAGLTVANALSVQFKGANLWGMGLIWVEQGTAIFHYFSLGGQTPNSFIVGARGSRRKTGADTMLVLSSVVDTPLNEITKYIAGVEKVELNGVPFIVRPVVDILASNF